MIPIRKNADWYARGVGGAAAREIKSLMRAGLAGRPRAKSKPHARGVGGAAAREIKALYQPATCLIESMNWRAGMRNASLEIGTRAAQGGPGKTAGLAPGGIDKLAYNTLVYES